MRKYLAVVVMLVVSAGFACSKSTPSATSESSPAAAVSSASDDGGATAACPDLSADNPFVITIQNMAFEPSCLTASASSTIKIVNADSVDHTFTIDGTQVDVTIVAGQTFNGESAGLKPGEYSFRCKIHPSMTGTITVI
jgi:plastocyanin